VDDQKPNFYSILTAPVRYCNTISDFSKILFSEITALCNKNGYCNATNEKFSEWHNKQARTISRSISELNKAGFIKLEITKTGAGTFRKIYPICKIPHDKNVVPPHDKNVVPGATKMSYQKNNTSKNITSKRKEKKKPTQKELLILDSIKKQTEEKRKKVPAKKETPPPSGFMKLYEITLANYSWPPEIETAPDLKKELLIFFDYLNTVKTRFGAVASVNEQINAVKDFLKKGATPAEIIDALKETAKNANIHWNPNWTKDRKRKATQGTKKQSTPGNYDAVRDQLNDPNFANIKL
jgi:hypothetical protein